MEDEIDKSIQKNCEANEFPGLCTALEALNLDQDFFKDNDPGSHLKNKFHAKIFVQNILNLLE